MKTVSLIAAGLLAFGLTAARAEVGGKASGGTTVTIEPPPPANADAKATPPPAVGADTTVTPSEITPPSAGPPGGVGATTPGSAGADLNIDPQAQPAPVVAPPKPPIMPPARVINANTAAIYGGVVEPTAPVQALPRPGAYRDSGAATANTWVGRLGTGMLLGGGFEDFTNTALRDMTGGAGSWNARVLAGTRQFVGVEAAYVGAARGVDALGVQSNALLVSNGVEGAVRLNVPVVMRSRQLLEPFAFVGLGWQNYRVTNTNVNTSSLASSDDVMSLPMGGGLEYAIGRFMADARFTYRSTYYNDLMRTGGNLNNWGVSGQVGFSF
jgi:hypothetical protein